MSVTRKARIERIGDDLGELIAKHERGRSPATFRKYRDDPVGFCKELLGFEPWSKQVEICASVLNNKRTVVRGHHGAGKDAILAALILWACYARDMLCVAISATERQLIGQLWGEISRFWTQQNSFPGELFAGNLRINGERRINAMTSGSTSNLTGWHNHRGTGTFIAISESQAESVGDTAFDAAAGNAASEGSRVVVVGNPTEPQGRFFEVTRLATWHPIRISAFDHPNIVQGKVLIAGGPAPSWPADMAAEYGIDSPFYRSRVLGEFPSESSDALITADRWDRAVELHKSGAFNGEAKKSPAVLGVDPARYGSDSTCLCIRRGCLVTEFIQWRGADTMHSVDRVEAEVRRLLKDRETQKGLTGVEAAWVDEVGVGAGVLDRLAERLPRMTWIEYKDSGHSVTMVEHHVAAFGLSAGKKAGRPDRFTNLRSQAYWHLRKLLEDSQIALPDIPELREELLATRVVFQSDGRTALEPKDAVKARIGRSPDRADALVISLAPLLERADRKPRVMWA
jgi:phage terminase large subunit